MPVPVFAVWLQACDKVTCPRFHSDGLVVQGDDVGADLRPVAVWLVPLQEEAGRRGVTRLRGGREIQESEGGDLVGICRRGPETHLLAVWAGTCLIHRLKKNTERVRDEGDEGQVGGNLRTEKRRMSAETKTKTDR